MTSFLSSFFFSWDISRLIALLFAILGMTVALYRIKRDLLLNIKVDIGKSIGTANSILILSIAIMISSQYYGEIKGREVQKMIPEFDISSISKIITPKLISFINPQFKTLSDKGSTVDEFILETQKGHLENGSFYGNEEQELEKIIESQGEKNLTPEQKFFLKEEAQRNFENSENGIIASSESIILEEGRKRLSQMSEKEISGLEKISDVFSDIVNNKINGYFVPSIDQKNMPVLPIVIAAILFFTIASLGNILSLLLIQLVKLAFKTFLKFNWIAIKKIQTEVESIE